MGYQTDVAAEARESYGDIDGVTVKTRVVEKTEVTETVIETEEAGKKLGKKPGTVYHP